jgi:hypothetical protein
MHFVACPFSDPVRDVIAMGQRRHATCGQAEPTCVDRMKNRQRSIKHFILPIYDIAVHHLMVRSVSRLERHWIVHDDLCEAWMRGAQAC